MISCSSLRLKRALPSSIAVSLRSHSCSWTTAWAFGRSMTKSRRISGRSQSSDRPCKNSFRFGLLGSSPSRNGSWLLLVCIKNLDPPRALRAAFRAASQASVEGSFAFAIPPMQFIVDAKRKARARLDLAVALVALSQAQEIIGQASASDETIGEAQIIATQIADAELQQVVQDQKLIKRVRRELRGDDLLALRELRERYKAEGRVADSARLAIEEGAILISVGDHSGSIPILREARAGFETLGDSYGVYIATRNLIASLNMEDGGRRKAARGTSKPAHA